MDDLDKIFLDSQNAKKDFIELFEKILEIKIKEVKFVEKEYFKSIDEYDFSLNKFDLICCDDKKIQIYLKSIKGGKIKESIFCFWSFLYEKFLRKNDNSIINRNVIIKQRKNSESDCDIVLTFNQSLDYCAEIRLIKLKKFASKYKRIGRWLDNLQVKSEDILFIGRDLKS